MYRRNTASLMLFVYSSVFATAEPNAPANSLQPAIIKQEKKVIEALPVKEPPCTEKKERTIIVKNAITPEMIKYRFWGTYYSPTKFYLSINNNSVQSNESCSCAVNEKNIVEVTYHYEFKNGMVTGSKCIEFELPNNTPNVDITFSWDDRHRLKSSVGRAINAKHGTMKSTKKFL